MMNRLFATIAGWFEDDKSRSKWRGFLAVSVIMGLGAIALRSGGRDTASLGASAILAGASFFSGALIGFLFGIPKTGPRKSEDASASATDYQPNTNLEDVSDWLSKMVVGITLSQLYKIPHLLDQISTYWEPTLGRNYSRAFATGIIVYFATVGFLVGYLWTRLALVGDFIESDPRRLMTQLLKQVAQSAQRNPEVTERSPDRDVITTQELDAARQLATLTTDSGVTLDEMRKQIRALAAEYESVRAAMSPGAERTRRMEVIASQMRTFSIAAYSLLSELVQSDSAGQRLAAVTLLQARPNPKYYSWLADRLRDEKPFIGYHAAVALLNAARAATTPEEREAVSKAIAEAQSHVLHLEAGTDRVTVLRKAADVVKKPS